jgi:hypothetical protein
MSQESLTSAMSRNSFTQIACDKFYPILVAGGLQAMGGSAE